MKSGRGGSREGAGRKTTWVSGCKQEDTKPIRVPKAIAAQLLEVAHKLDAGENIDLDTKLKEEKVTKSNSELKLTAVEECLIKWRQYSDQCSPNPNTRMHKLREMLVELESIVWAEGLFPGHELLESVIESEDSNEQFIESDTKSSELIEQDSISITAGTIESVTESELSSSARQLELLNPLKEEQLKANEMLVLPEPPISKPEPHSEIELAKRLKKNRSNVNRYKIGKAKDSLLEWSFRHDPDGFGWEYSSELKKYVPVRVSDSVTE